MAIVKWDPFGNLTTLQERINRLFDEAFPARSSGGEMSLSTWRPAVDIYETDQAIMIHAELPGVQKQDIAIELRENTLILKGHRSSKQEIREDSYYRRERSFGNFQRSFTLPGHVNPEQIKANFKDGVLEIELPKPAEQRPKQIEIK